MPRLLRLREAGRISSHTIAMLDSNFVSASRQKTFAFPAEELDPDDFAPEIAGSVRVNGKIRLYQTRGWFLDSWDVPRLIDVYQEWKNTNEYLHLAFFEGDVKIREVAVLCSKRGNSVYCHRVRDRVMPLLNLKDLPPGNRSCNKTKMLFITLTYDTKLCPPSEAWLSISDQFDSFLDGLRKKFGKLSYVKVFESTKQHYPHLHLLVVFKESEFSYFSLKGKFRIPGHARHRIRSGWHSFVDVEAIVSPGQAIAYMLKYLLKTHGGSVSGKTPWQISQEGVSKTLALLWVHHKRGYSISEDFQEALTDLIAKPCVSHFIQGTLTGERLQRWVLLGIKTAGELGIEDDPPPWFVVLWEK